jgi:hypothetical protein
MPERDITPPRTARTRPQPMRDAVGREGHTTEHFPERVEPEPCAICDAKGARISAEGGWVCDDCAAPWSRAEIARA